MTPADNYPANGATVKALTAIKIAFSEPITSKDCKPGTNVTLLEVGSASGLGFNCENLTIEDNTITLAFAPLSAGTYMVKVDTGAVSDMAGNAVTLISSASSYTFTVGTSPTEAPKVIYSEPSPDGALS